MLDYMLLQSRNLLLLALVVQYLWQVADGLLPALTNTATRVHGGLSIVEGQSTVLYAGNSLGRGSRNKQKQKRGLRRNGDIKIEGPETEFGRKYTEQFHSKKSGSNLRHKTERLIKSHKAGDLTGKQIHEATELFFIWSKTMHQDQCCQFMEEILMMLIEEKEVGNVQSIVTAEMYYSVSTLQIL